MTVYGNGLDGAAPKAFSRPAPEGTVDVALCTTALVDAVVATHPEAEPGSSCTRWRDFLHLRLPVQPGLSGGAQSVTTVERRGLWSSSRRADAAVDAEAGGHVT
jgi:hypothetical protein